MLKNSKFLAIAAVLVSAATLSSCGVFSRNSSQGSYSEIGVQLIGYDSLTPQNIIVKLGQLESWPLRIRAKTDKYFDTVVGVSVIRIDAPENAKSIRTGNTVTVCDCLNHATSRTLNVRLVAGKYAVTVNGAISPVTIDVIKGSKDQPAATTTATAKLQ